LAYPISFIEVESKRRCNCNYCGRKKLSETDKFYEVYWESKAINIIVCELCKGGFSTSIHEGQEKSYATHLTFYLKHSYPDLKKKMPTKIFDELESAMKNYELGDFCSSYRNIGFIAEWLTNWMFIRKYGAIDEKNPLAWEAKLGRLLHDSKMNEENPEEPLLHQLSSLKWFRNMVSHPFSKFELTGEDIRLGLVSIVYVLQQAYKYSLI
jgi:hypothetical protein